MVESGKAQRVVGVMKIFLYEVMWGQFAVTQLHKNEKSSGINSYV